MPKTLVMAPGTQRKHERYMIQAFLKVDLEWTSILLYESRSAAAKGMRKMQRLELERLQSKGFKPAAAHMLRVKKWQGEELSILGERLIRLTVAA